MGLLDFIGKLVQIPGRLTSIAIEKVVCGADEVYDDVLQKRQSELNAVSLRGIGEVVNLTENVTVSDDVPEGEQKTIMYVNDTEEVIEVIVPSQTYKTPDGETIIINVPAGGYGEVSLLNIGGTIFARGC